jgi:hypothetical protein
MTVRITEETIRKMAIDAMRDRSPRRYCETEASGELEAIIEQRVEAAMETYFILYNQAIDKVARSDGDMMSRIQMGFELVNRAGSSAIAQATEFEDEESFYADLEYDVRASLVARDREDPRAFVIFSGTPLPCMRRLSDGRWEEGAFDSETINTFRKVQDLYEADEILAEAKEAFMRTNYGDWTENKLSRSFSCVALKPASVCSHSPFPSKAFIFLVLSRYFR